MSKLLGLAEWNNALDPVPLSPVRAENTPLSKKFVLAELDNSFRKIYEQRVKALIKEKTRKPKPKEDKKSKYIINKINEDSLSNIIYNQKKYDEDIYSRFDEKNKNNFDIIERYSKIDHSKNPDHFIFSNSKRVLGLTPEQLKEKSHADLARNMADLTLGENSRLRRFKSRLDELESQGKKEDLESILAATHIIARDPKLSPEWFVDAFDSLPSSDEQTYISAALKFLVAEDSKKEPRLTYNELNEISISKLNLSDPYFKLSNSPYILNTESLIPKTDEEILEELNTPGIRRNYLLDGKEKSLSLPFSEANFSLSGANKFFFEVEGFYSAFGEKEGTTWLNQVKVLLGKDKKIGKEFALHSRPVFEVYKKILDWSLEDLIADHEIIGSKITEVASVADRFKGFELKRRRSLIRHLINPTDEYAAALSTLNKAPLPESSFLEQKLPEDINPSDLVSALIQTSDIYSLCKDNQVSSDIVGKRLCVEARSRDYEGYIKELERVRQRAENYIEFVKEQKKDPSMNLGFNDVSAQNTLRFYEEVLGKSFVQFRRDFESTGTALQEIPQIASMYEKLLDRDKLKSFMNYVTKARSRDLIADLNNIHLKKSLMKTVVEKLGSDVSKKDLVKSMQELSKVYSFLQSLDYQTLYSIENPESQNNFRGIYYFFRDLFGRRNDNQNSNLNKLIGVEGIIDNELSKVDKTITGQEVIDALRNIKKRFYSTLIGDLEVPQDLENAMNNVVIAYNNNTGSSNGINTKKALEFIASTYIQKGAKETANAIRRVKPNKNLEKKLLKSGINIDAFKTGISRTYYVSTDEGSLTRLKERINSEVDQVWDRLGLLYTPKDEQEVSEETAEKFEELKNQVENLRKGTLREQIEGAEKFISSYEFEKDQKNIKLEVKGHIQTARSLTGSIKEMQSDATFYVSQDPLESLHMGQYFGSCLSLSKNHGGVNAWAAVVQTMDSNKNVIYAKTEDGKYIGRNRTVLTDKGIMCTRFYQNGNMNLNGAWISYLQDFANHTGQEVMIPTNFAAGSLGNLLENKVKEGLSIREKRNVEIAPAYFSAFYGDGLTTSKKLGGNIAIEAEVYILKPEVKK